MDSEVIKAVGLHVVSPLVIAFIAWLYFRR